MIVAGANRARKTILEKILGRRRPGHRAGTKGSSESVPFMLQSEAIPPSPRAARFVLKKAKKSPLALTDFAFQGIERRRWGSKDKTARNVIRRHAQLCV